MIEKNWKEIIKPSKLDVKEDNNNELNLDLKDNNIGNDIKKILDAFPEGKVLKN